ncbi:MAG: hypothetical protein IJ675_02045, partial [Pseudobutyrivibrio sp.]|nr:hypothetical protein [Pseudobutyrivibrio sp.]
MLAVDYLILNRDRHGANIEVLKNSRTRKIRIAPLFDHGLTFLFGCRTKEDIAQFDIMKDRMCQNFIGGRSTLENLELIENKDIFTGKLTEASKQIIFADLASAIPTELIDKTWDMLYARWYYYESL